MCGIIGVVAPASVNVSPILIEGLKRLEYRGYDSAGIATLSSAGELLRRRSEGKLSRLEKELQEFPIDGHTGIGHTRWATHGRPTKNNAHPHATSRVAVVHNGIIENFGDLRARLEANGHTMASDTDTEVIPHLITSYLEDGLAPDEAVAKTMNDLEGSFALAILIAGHEKLLMAARRGSPLVIGHGKESMYVGSDAIALAPFTSRIAYLEDGDFAQLSETAATVWNQSGRRVNRDIRQSQYSGALLSKGGYRHYMLKEIHEQPAVLSDMIKEYVDPAAAMLRLPKLGFDLAQAPQMTLVACGTSYYASMVAKYWLEKFAHLPTATDIASEFRYRDTPLRKNGAALFISQSGETADTLAALRFARQNGQHTISIVNVRESSMAQLSDAVIPILAGVEIGVASTKAFTAQLLVMACLTLAFAEARGTMDGDQRAEALAALVQLPAVLMNALGYEETLRKLARAIMDARDVLYVGRGTVYPVALEGALKLKELTYIHAEGIAAGELKHGPIALIDKHVPVIALAPSDALFEKTYSNIQEISARGGRIIAFCDAKGAGKLENIAWRTVTLPQVHPLLVPMLYAVPMQLLAYHVAVAMGKDVDQPRNLAKSVTVE